jgi:type IV pilus assembly protein PilM
MVDVDVFALQNAYEINYGIDPGRVIALLNVGASIMNINIIKGATSIFNRDIAVGGNQYTDAIQKDLNLSFDQAEALKRGSRVEGRGAGKPRADPPGGIREHRPRDPEDLRLLQGDVLGGPYRPHLPRRRHEQGSRTPELLADRFEAGVEIMNPFNNITYNPRDFDPEFINEIGPSAAIAVGLAARKVGDR